MKCGILGNFYSYIVHNKLLQVRYYVFFVLMTCESESCTVLSDSLQPHGLYSPWNSPGQNTGVGSCSLLQGIFPTQGLNPGLLHCKWILYQLSYLGSLKLSSKWLVSPWWRHTIQQPKFICAQSLQSCPALCDPTDHGPPGSSVHGILQARILEWVAISFSSDKVWSEVVKWSRPVVSDSATSRAVAYQAPLSMGFPRQKYWSGLPFPSPKII